VSYSRNQTWPLTRCRRGIYEIYGVLYDIFQFSGEREIFRRYMEKKSGTKINTKAVPADVKWDHWMVKFLYAVNDIFMRCAHGKILVCSQWHLHEMRSNVLKWARTVLNELLFNIIHLWRRLLISYFKASTNQITLKMHSIKRSINQN
jgi:hypothetical protein